jgi:ATP-binding cassette subfamily B protein
MDRIIVLEQGKIIEQGTHQQLLIRRGKYYEMWQHQKGDFLGE